MAGAKPKPPPISVSYLEEDIHNDSLAFHWLWQYQRFSLTEWINEVKGLNISFNFWSQLQL